jgi:hypothetical protein
MWAPKSKADAGIFGKNRIIGDIQGKGRKGKKKIDINTAKMALLDLKNLMGARKYMNSLEIQGVLKKQKVRLGDIISKLDAEMANHPRASFDAWKPQQLGSLWNIYMDEKFAEAKRRTNQDMDTYLDLLVKTWTPAKNKDKDHKDFLANIEKIKKEWTLEKRRPWMAPW